MVSIVRLFPPRPFLSSAPVRLKPPENSTKLLLISVPGVLVLQFVAEALQHSELVRSKLYYDIGWNKDHPVLLRIKLRFSPIPTKVGELFCCVTIWFDVAVRLSRSLDRRLR